MTSLGLLLTTVCLVSTVTANFNGADWMKDNMHVLGRRTLKQICIPGSHDAGMSELNGGTALIHKCNVLNQSVGIRRQLELGARYLDIRPIISGGKFKTGHYSKGPGGVWVGGNGQTMESVINDINNFINGHRELVVVYLSHSLNTDVGKIYRSFSQGEWERLFNLLDRTANLFHAPGNAYLPGIALGHYTSNGSRGSVVYVVEECNLAGRHGKGYFYPNNLNLFDKYSNTPHFSSMSSDQLRKMREESSRKYFLLSWTLTQGPKHLTMCRVNLAKSIKEMAASAHSNYQIILNESSMSAFPNIVYVDDITTNKEAELCMAINNKLKF